MPTPQTQAPEWSATNESPWLGWNKAARLFDAFTMRTTVLDRDLTSPPGACADGARYLVAAGATGAWSGKDGQLAIAYGANAANGWIFAPLAVEGMVLKVVDEALELIYRNGAWAVATSPVTRIQDLDDVDMAGVADGYTLRWDQSNGVWFPSPDSGVGAASISTFRGALVTKSADQTAANYTSETAIAWDSEVYDTDAIHDNAVNNTRLTVPAGVSKVRLSASVMATAIGGTYMGRMRVKKNGAYNYIGAIGNSGNSVDQYWLTAMSPIIDVTPGDYFEVTWLQFIDTSITIEANMSWFAMEIVQ